MFETVTTNAAGILTIVVLWSTLVWLSTYMYMSEKIRRKAETIRFLDDYINQDQALIADLRRGNMLRDEDIEYYVGMVLELENEIRRETEKNKAIEREFGHVIDDYIEHYYSDGSWKHMKWEA